MLILQYLVTVGLGLLEVLLISVPIYQPTAAVAVLAAYRLLQQQPEVAEEEFIAVDKMVLLSR
jgi:hypothetical protein